MSCGCQDKENDALIIEHYNKKKMAENENKAVQNIIHVQWDGYLCDFHLYIPEESLILTIDKKDGLWDASCIDWNLQ